MLTRIGTTAIVLIRSETTCRFFWTLMSLIRTRLIEVHDDFCFEYKVRVSECVFAGTIFGVATASRRTTKDSIGTANSIRKRTTVVTRTSARRTTCAVYGNRRRIQLQLCLSFRKHKNRHSIQRLCVLLPEVGQVVLSGQLFSKTSDSEKDSKKKIKMKILEKQPIFSDAQVSPTKKDPLMNLLDSSSSQGATCYTHVVQVFK